MKLLSKAASSLMARLVDAENEAGQLLSELDGLDTRLHRAFTAVSVDNWITNLNVERNRMLEDEKQAKRTAGLMKVPALGIYGLVCSSMGRKPDWKQAFNSVFEEQPFGDVRVAVGLDDTKLVNVSGTARSRGMTVDQVIGYLEAEGHRVLKWTEFVARADNLRRTALRGKAEHLGAEDGGRRHAGVRGESSLGRPLFRQRANC